jgi:hypothetical protein
MEELELGPIPILILQQGLVFLLMEGNSSVLPPFPARPPNLQFEVREELPFLRLPAP